MVSDARYLPSTWNVETGHNILWSQPLGSLSYSGPILAGDLLLIGTNNEGRRDPTVTGDKGILMAFRASDGTFLWQIAHDKLNDPAQDWSGAGIRSAPVVEGNRIYYLNNRCEVVCADQEGTVLWTLDLREEAGVIPQAPVGGAISHLLLVGDSLYLATGNGTIDPRRHPYHAYAPSFVAVNKHTGRLTWDAMTAEDSTIPYGSWGSPSYGMAGNRAQTIFPGGNGWLYSLNPATGEDLWKFDANRLERMARAFEIEEGFRREETDPYAPTSRYNSLIATPVLHNNKVYIGTGTDPDDGNESPGFLYCIDASRSGDITTSGVLWHSGSRSGGVGPTVSTVAISDGLLFAADLSGRLYCLNADTGAHHWTWDTFGAVVGSPLVADGKVYLGNEDGSLTVLRAEANGNFGPPVVSEIPMGEAIYTTPVAKDGVLYVATRNRLFAISEQ